MKQGTSGRRWFDWVTFVVVAIYYYHHFLELDILKKPRAPVEPPGFAGSSRIRVVPFEGKTMGADVFGFNPKFQTQHDLAIITNALEEYLVLVFHNVSSGLTPTDHVRFAKKLGPVDPAISSPPNYLKHGIFNSPDQVKRAVEMGATGLGNSMLKAAATSVLPREITRIVKEPTDVLAFGEGWHSDLTYLSATPFAAVLVSRELPPTGKGNTHFLDMRVAFDKLPEHIKSKISSLKANHTDGHESFSSHPVVRHDNKYGRPALFVNKAFTRHLVGKTDPKLLSFLMEHIESMPSAYEQAFLNITWKQSQMVLWDNRYTQHAAQGSYKTRREMHRCIVSGTVPF